MTQGSFWDLQKMIKQVTMKCAFWNYYNYGCHCGLGGKGTPKDGTDQCCYLHDCCYERLKNHGCNAKFNSYSYVYLNGKIYCADAEKSGSQIIYSLHSSRNLQPDSSAQSMNPDPGLTAINGILAGLSGAQGSLLEFRKMINQATRKSALLSYYGYGCYCGSDGRGEPKDATDWCCRAHHCCYERLKANGCYGNRQRYSYTYKDGDILCALGSWCEEQVCDCDKSTTLCLERNLKTFNSRYVRYRDSKCTGFTPRC
ncbi:Group IID secretory phospholipase A2 [Chelonia mydas]|uniref:Phospholipase A2 n=1 Tax=Chelonia mydas TaxID=8469 RepID=M7BJE6_CHEMY|nr:Group IID secretory phospholipase A2 [Chelonia mydas]